MAYFNLTPHSVDVYPSEAFTGLQQVNPTTWVADSVDRSKAIANFPSDGVARISVATEEIQHLPGGIPAVRTAYGEAMGIPDNIKPEDVLIVSLPMQSMAKAAGHPAASQMVSPYKVVRAKDAEGKPSGNVLGCMGLTY